MKTPSFTDALAELVREDPRYPEQAYFFIREALDHAIKMHAKPLDGPGRHVSGTELLEGIREFGLSEYGAMCRTVLRSWGIHETVDFGHLVFNLVGKNVLGKTDDDRLEDFENGYDFEDAFSAPFRPRPKTPSRPLPEER